MDKKAYMYSKVRLKSKLADPVKCKWAYPRTHLIQMRKSLEKTICTILSKFMAIAMIQKKKMADAFLTKSDQTHTHTHPRVYA